MCDYKWRRDQGGTGREQRGGREARWSGQEDSRTLALPLGPSLNPIYTVNKVATSLMGLFEFTLKLITFK